MHGFCGILGLDTKQIDKKKFIKSMNLAYTMQIDSVSEENFFSVVSYHESAPLKGNRVYKTKDIIFHFSGDLIGYKEIPWKEVETNFSSSNFEWFSTLRGLFAFAIYNKRLNTISLISDHLAQLPLYYGCFDNSFIFSTDLSTFTTLKNIPDFNINWLYEYMFFNYPIDRTTFLKGISRLRPLSILSYDQNSNKIKEFLYGKYFKKAKNISTGKEALNINIKIFKKRIPKYYCEGKKTLAAISGGFDSRTILAMAPEGAKVETYTYGVEGSKDLIIVSTFINKLGIKHSEILFDKDFKRSLPDLIYETVRLSGGVQPILRSTLIFVYRTLYKNFKDAPVVIGGISGDFYRGWDYPTEPSILSSGMKHFFQTGEKKINKGVYLKMFNVNFDKFEKHIKNVLDNIEKRYGFTKNPESRMSYNIYETSPKYYGGEMAIASNYFTFRQPFWDVDLIDLAYKTDCSHIGYLKRLKEKRDIKYKPYFLQTKVIASNPRFKKIYIKGLPTTLFAYGNVSLLKVSRLFIRSFAYLKGYRKIKKNIEDWDNWFGKTLNSEFDLLLNEDSLILEYIKKDLIVLAKNSNDIHLLSKLATTEIILNLIKNRWDIN